MWVDFIDLLNTKATRLQKLEIVNEREKKKKLEKAESLSYLYREDALQLSIPQERRRKRKRKRKTCDFQEPDTAHQRFSLSKNFYDH